ncbi:MFS general substrate transporter [Meredithblackwellia eburnea MCA 4105]
MPTHQQTMSDSSSSFTIADSSPQDELASDSKGFGSNSNKNLQSREALDLAGDLDLERQLQEPNDLDDAATTVEVVRGTKDSEKSLPATGPIPASAPPSKSSGPLTLAPDDAENPRNWSTSKKVLVDVILCIWVLSLTYSSTAYVASLTALEKRFNTSQEVAILGITLFVLGFAAGPLLLGPSSELFGRRAVYITTGIFYSGFSFGAAWVNNLPGLLVLRFLMGFAGAASINNVPASIGDFTIAANRNQYTILYALCAFGGPSLGPLCSNFIETGAGWQWNLRVQAIFNTLCSICVCFVPETHGPTLYKWQQQKNGNQPSKLKLGQVIGVYKTALSRPILYLFTEPTVTLCCLYLSALYGILYGFFEAFTVVFLEMRHFKPNSYGLTYIGLGVGFFVACVLLATVQKKYYDNQAAMYAAKGMKTQPEARLGLAYPSAILCPISLFLFAWTAPFPHVHWIVPCIAEALFGGSMLCIFSTFVPYLIDCYLQTAASALAAGMASRALVGCVFPLFAIQMYHRLTVQGATSLLAGLACCLMPIPFVFRRYGSTLRERSKNASNP